MIKRVVQFCGVLLVSQELSLAVDYYVATTGDDLGAGTLASPFATIQHAVDQTVAGDTVYLRGGTYHEEVSLNGKAGTAASPITVTNYAGEVVTLDGTVPITSSWTQDVGNVFKTTLTEDVTQLFVDGELMTLARFPNALVWSDDMWTARTSMQTGSTRSSGNGNVIGNATIGNAGISFEGCVGMYNVGNFASDVSLVTSHTASSDSFTYSPATTAWRGLATSAHYFFEGGLDNAERGMLDTAQEWAYDESTKTLYLWADDGLDPNGRSIAGKVQTYAITGDAATQYIVIDGLDFLSTTFKFTSSDGITIQNCDFLYYSSSERALGSTDAPDTARISGTSSDSSEDVKIYNNTFQGADGPGIICNYLVDPLIENNLFKDINYTCKVSSSVRIDFTRNLVLRRNSLINSGSSSGILVGRDTNDSVVYPYVVEYNYTERCSLLQTDGASIYAASGKVVGSITRYNWMYDNHERDLRWDGANSPLTGVEANLVRNVSVSNQNKAVSLSGAAFKLKGDFHEVYNNTSVGARGEFQVALEKGGNANTETRNNASDDLQDDPIPGISSSNYIGQNEPRSMSVLLRRVDDFDFRPKADAVELIDQGEIVSVEINGATEDVTAGYNGVAPDLGAYEYGDDNYWIPGFQTSQASHPIPSDGLTNAYYDSELIWLGGLNAVSYNVYLGTTGSALVFKGNQANNIYSPGGLDNNQEYFWRIDSVLADGAVVTGDVWAFHVNEHRPRAISKRYMVVEDGSVAVTLEGVDPDGDAVTYVLSSQPSYGTLTGTRPNLVYTPNADFFGEDEFQYIVNDGSQDSAIATVIITVTEGGNDAPYFNLDVTYRGTAVVGDAYTGFLAGTATDPDGDALSYTILSGPSWLSSAPGGSLSGTPEAKDIGVNSWVIEVEDSEGLSSTGTLTIRVVEGDVLAIEFTDLTTSFLANSLNVDGDASDVSVSGIVDGNDYVYSVIYTGKDYDGDTQNDILTFDVRVKGWSGGVSDVGLNDAGRAKNATVTIGTNSSQVAVADSKFTVIDTQMNNGESLEFLLENLDVNLTDSDKFGRVFSTGFTGARMDQTSTTGNSHRAIISEGSGTGFLGIEFDNSAESGVLSLGRESLFLSSDFASGTRSTSWGVENVDFGIEVSVASSSSYTAWINGHGLGGSDQSTDADTENGGDGYRNFLEFALGMDPTEVDVMLKVNYYSETENNVEYFVYEYARPIDYEDYGFTYSILVTTDLENYATGLFHDEAIVDPTDFHETVKTRYLMTEARKFFKLKVDLESAEE